MSKAAIPEEFQNVSKEDLVRELMAHRRALAEIVPEGLAMLRSGYGNDLHSAEMKRFSESLHDGMLVYIGMEKRDPQLEKAMNLDTRQPYSPVRQHQSALPSERSQQAAEPKVGRSSPTVTPRAVQRAAGGPER